MLDYTYDDDPEPTRFDRYAALYGGGSGAYARDARQYGAPLA